MGSNHNVEEKTIESDKNKIGVGHKEAIMKIANDFVTNTSMHGWSFFGAPQSSSYQKLFWFLVLIISFACSGYLIKENTVIFMTSFTIINLEDRSRDLDDVYFPSIVICNINPLRKSFIYWIHENLQKSGKTDVSIGEVFDVLGNQYFSASNITLTEDNKNLLDFILESKFFKEEFQNFKREKLDGSNFTITKSWNRLHMYHQLEEASEALGEYTDVTKKTYHENFLPELASQWKTGQMIPFVKWDGMDPDDVEKDIGELFLEVGYATSFGLCSFITPYYKKMPADVEDVTVLKNLPKGALNGENNGLSVLVDAETFDYGNGFAGIGVRAGVGFKAAIVHHLDIANMETSGVQVDVGAVTQLAVSTTLINITKSGTDFNAYDRKCWLEEEIHLEHFSYDEDYRYEMSNCLVEAAVQVAHEKCSCYPGYLLLSNDTCYGESLNCFRNEFYYLGKYRHVMDNGVNKTCMAACRDQTFSVSVSNNKYPGEESYNHRPAFCVVVRKLFTITCPDKHMRQSLEKRFPGLCDDINGVMENGDNCVDRWNKKGLGDSKERIDIFQATILRYMKENIALINVYIKEPYCELIQQDRYLTWINFLSNMGGILGLCVGASMISLIEIVWYCLLCCVSITRK